MPVTSNHLQLPQAHNSPALAQDPTDSRFAALAGRLDLPDFGCSLHLSGDAGRTWIPAQPVPRLPGGAEKCYAPEVAFSSAGTLYFLFVGLQGPQNVPMGAFLVSSDDRGRSFSAPRRVLGPNVFQVRLAASRTSGGADRLHLVWVQANGEPGLGSMPPPPNPILSAHSDDGGASFSRPVRVNPPARRLAMAPVVAAGPDSVHVLYYDLGDDLRDYHGLEGPRWEKPWSLIATRSEDGSAFGTESVVDGNVVPTERVMLIFTMPPASLALTSSGDLVAAWHDARAGDWDVFARRSQDGGKSWGDLMRLPGDRTRGHQYLPRLAASPSGRVDAVFYDRRRDPANTRNEVVYAEVSEAEISPRATLSSTGFSSQIGARYAGPAAEGQFDFGTRLALVAGRAGALAAWTDTRNSLSPGQQEIFSTTVVLGGTGARALGLAVFAAALPLAAMAVLRRRRKKS